MVLFNFIRQSNQLLCNYNH